MTKRFISGLLSLLVPALLFISCNLGGSGEAYTLKMRLAKGDHFTQDMDIKMEMAMEMMGQKMNTKMDMKGDMIFEVLGDSSNLKKLTMTYGNLKMGMGFDGMGMNNMNFDSVMTAAASRINGRVVTMYLNDKNEVVETSGFGEVMIDETLEAATKEQIKKMFSKEQMNSMLGMMFQMYPDKPVRVGDSWEKEIETAMAEIKMKAKGKYKLKSVKDGIAYIDVSGKFNGKGSMNQQGVNVDMDMSGDQEGTISIGLADGYLKDNNFKMNIKAEMEVMGQKVPMNIKAYYLMKGK